MNQNLTNTSKFLSLVLRHKPDAIGISLDENGWAEVDFLLQKINESGNKINAIDLDFLVENNSKKRFIFNEDKTKIRANQGHSIQVELHLTKHIPPEILYHGTAEKFVESIKEKGLIKQQRQHVHLSNDIETANKVGQRHGKPFIFKVKALEMYNDNFEFFISENNVWLTDFVPSKYLEN